MCHPCVLADAYRYGILDMRVVYCVLHFILSIGGVVLDFARDYKSNFCERISRLRRVF